MRKFITAAGLGTLLVLASPSVNTVNFADGESPAEIGRILYENSFEGFGKLRYPTVEDSTSVFSLSDNGSLEEGGDLKFTMPPHSRLNLNSNFINYSPDSLVSVNYPFNPPKVFDKFSYLMNNTHSKSKIKLSYNGSEVVVTIDGISEVRNGPFIVFSDGKNLEMKSVYGKYDVTPMKVVLEKEGVKTDSMRFVDEWNYPPYAVFSRFEKKNSIDWKDAKKILGFYDNLYGDYFQVDYKSLVCSDVATLVMKTAGINLGEILKKNGIEGNSYLERNIPALMNLINKEGLSNDVHLLFKGNLEKILNSDYSNLIPENFDLKKFSPGQVLLFTRFYLEGPMKGKVQRGDIHLGIISGTNGENIGEASMTTSHMTEPPYNENIMLTKVNFKKWYDHLRDYRGSDETSYPLTYRVLGVVDWLDVINHLKEDQSPSLPRDELAKYKDSDKKELSYVQHPIYNSSKPVKSLRNFRR